MFDPTGQQPIPKPIEFGQEQEIRCAEIVERTEDDTGKGASRKHSLSGADATATNPFVKRK